MELNEAFAAQSLACLAPWPGLNPESVNPNGVRVRSGIPGIRSRRGGSYPHNTRPRTAAVRWRIWPRTMCIGVGLGQSRSLCKAPELAPASQHCEVGSRPAGAGGNRWSVPAEPRCRCQCARLVSHVGPCRRRCVGSVSNRHPLDPSQTLDCLPPGCVPGAAVLESAEAEPWIH